MKKFTFGSDPEFILSDEKGKLKSAIGVVGGDRKNKLGINGNYFFYDNVLAECTVKPSTCAKEAVENIRDSLQTYSRIVYPHRLTTISGGNFEDDELLHKEARRSGCAVEHCAYGLKNVSPNKVKKAFREGNFRTAGGHVHLGTPLGKTHETCIMLVRMLDLFLGVASLVLDNSPNSAARRKIYGLAGRYRQPEYGVEYRTLGNFWLSSPRLVSLVFEICEAVICFTEERIYENFWSVDRERLESDDFWNECGDPATCHSCHGYDIRLFRNMFRMEKSQVKSEGKPILDLVFGHLPSSTKKVIFELCDEEFDMYKEWGL